MTSEISPSHGRESRFETKLSGVLLAISGLCGLPARRYAAALAARERERERESERARERERERGSERETERELKLFAAATHYNLLLCTYNILRYILIYCSIL